MINFEKISKKEVSKKELKPAPNQENNPEFIKLVEDYKLEFSKYFKGDKEKMEEKSEEISQYIEKYENDFHPANTHPDLIRYKAQRRALYELLNP